MRFYFIFLHSRYVPGPLHHPFQGSLKDILLVAKCLTELKRCDSKITKTITNKYHNECLPSKKSLWETTLITMKLPRLEIFLELLFWYCVQKAFFYKSPKKMNFVPCLFLLLWVHSGWVSKLGCFITSLNLMGEHLSLIELTSFWFF